MKSRKITTSFGLVREVRRRGWSVTRTVRGHWRVVGPGGVAFVPCKWRGDPRTRLNALCDVRRHAGIALCDEEV